MKQTLTIWIGLALAAAAMGCAAPDVEIISPISPDGQKHLAKGDKTQCTQGCSLKKHDIPPFTNADFLNTIEDYGKEPVDVASPALDKLLFYGKRTKALLEEHGVGGLSEEHIAFLKRELDRQHAVVSLRLIDDSGTVHVAVDRERVPLGKKMHLHPEILGDVQPMEFNGTALRVGLGHIWARY